MNYRRVVSYALRRLAVGLTRKNAQTLVGDKKVDVARVKQDIMCVAREISCDNEVCPLCGSKVGHDGWKS